jgi:hypothetical protein
MTAPVRISEDRCRAEVEVDLPAEFSGRWTDKGALDVREHAGTTWLWAYPELLLWPRDPRPVVWLFSPGNDNKRWCGDLWGLDQRGTLILVELKMARPRRRPDHPFRDFVRYRARTPRHFTARALAEHWFFYYLKELRHGPRDCRSGRTMPGILDYSSKRRSLCQWPALYHRIHSHIRSDGYLLDVLRGLIAREQRKNPPPHFVAFAVATHPDAPRFADDDSYRRLEAACCDRLHCRFGYGVPGKKADRVVLTARAVDPKELYHGPRCRSLGSSRSERATPSPRQ